MEDCLQDGAARIGDVSVLPIERDTVGGAIPVPEAQCASACRDCELLIERAIPQGLGSRDTAKAVRWVTRESGEGSAVHLFTSDYRRRVIAVNHPGWEAAGLESTINNHV